MLYQPLEALTHVAWALERAAAGARRCFEVLDRRDDVPDRADAMVLTDVNGAVGFDQITFGYDPERPILRGIDLMLDPAKRWRSSAGRARESQPCFRWCRAFTTRSPDVS